ncbi:MAG TPA: ABC transporter permease [Pyrinomonadaceae bacterium]|jgi:putative ABC transport system permease protein|nr:ABC transporter permease [Pyrinomonadaceae bacterium]
MLQDLIYAFRWLRKNPGFTVLSVLMLAVGIGVNTAMFSVINAVLLQPLPFPEADRIVWMNESGPEIKNRQLSYPNFLDWRQRNQVFESMALFRGWSVNLTGTDKPENLDARIVTADYFKVMRATPMLGRDFTAADDQPGAAPVVLISYGFWQHRFAGDPSIIGREILLDDKAHTVIGVAPPDFTHHGPPPLWVLMGPLNWKERDVRNAGNVVARLKPGVTIDQARAEMNRISQQLRQEHPVANAGADTVNVVSLQDSITRNVSTALKILFAAVGLVLLIACANVANLLLARAATRRKEFAVRAALGASRFRLVRQMLVESLVLSIAGGVLGLMLASWTISLLSRVAHETVPRMSSLALNGKILTFNLAVSLLTGILFGVLPALRSSRTDLHETLKDSSSTTTDVAGKKLRGTLVVAEVALSVALLVGAGLLVKSLVRLLSTDNGFDPNGVLTMELKVSRSRGRDKAELSRLLHGVLQGVQTQAGVDKAALSAALPGISDGSQNDIAVEGEGPRKKGELINVDWSIVTPDYFQAMKIPILRGRTFTRDEDEQGKPVVLVDENLARRFWPNEEAVGKHIAYDSPTWHEIIGVVPAVKTYGSEATPLIRIYTPMGRMPQRNALLLIHAHDVDAKALTAAVMRTVHDVDKDLPIADVATLDDILARESSTRRFNTLLFSVFAALALALAVTGVYGVLSYSVSQRTHEVGIRMALGAGRRDVLRLFMQQGMRLVLLGLVIGLGGAFVLTRLMSSLLFGVSATDKVTFVVVAFGLTLVGVCACYLPARRATKVDPLVALRYE